MTRSALKFTALAAFLALGIGAANAQQITATPPGACLAFGTAAGTCAQGGVITAGGPTGSATVAPIITYNAAGQLTTVTSATVTPAVGSITGLGTGVGTILATNGALAVSTQQRLTTGTAATYTTPAGARLLRVRIWGGGGGGGGSGTANQTAGGAGGTTTFNSITAIGGGASTANGGGGAGGTGGTGTALRMTGAPGGSSAAQVWTSTNFISIGGSGGGNGGGITPVAGTTQAGVAGVANTGGGGSGGTIPSLAAVTYVTYTTGGGGGQGEYAEFLIPSPSGTYSYTIAAGGTAGAQGTSGSAGAAGGTGYAVVDEYY